MLGYRVCWQVDKLESRTLRPSRAIAPIREAGSRTTEIPSLSPRRTSFRSDHCNTGIALYYGRTSMKILLCFWSRCPAYHRCACGLRCAKQDKTFIAQMAYIDKFRHWLTPTIRIQEQNQPYT